MTLKETITIIIIVLISIITLKLISPKPKNRKPVIKCTLDTVTIYNPTVSQCDDTPLITASNDTIDLQNFPKNWLALSRDLINSKEFNYGDTVYIYLDSVPIQMIIKDTKNKRYNNHGDILTKNKKLNLWKNVTIVKF